VVLPELWVRKYGPQLIELGVPYAILVQGGYLIGSGDRRVLRKAYDEAKVILTNSEKSTQLVKYAFPSVSMKIRRVYLKIDPTSFTPAQKKDNLITYMPRRLPEHANYLKFLLHDKLPSDWQLAAIDKLNEQEVANILSKSKIFLSFSDREGFGLPPLEAALAGNVVIGYTGEAGREYWRSPLFIEIMQGDLLTMAETVLEVANRKENLLHDQVLMMIAQLRETYSPEAFKHSVEQFISEYVLRN
jgi:glycosyltransferase involved in cell wall biosynthesis